MKIYLDNAATTKPDDAVIEAMIECMKDNWGNSSSLHYIGQSSAGQLEEARDICAKAIGCSPKEILFTSGATEANNIAILGYARKNKHKGNHLITTNTEHHAVLYAFEQLEKEGFDVTYLPVDSEGMISLRQLKDAMREDTILISIMHANNEIGVINPIKEIGEIAHKRGIAFHTDAVQSFGKIPIDVKKMNIDMLSVSAHKLHGPKGVGFLYVKHKLPLEPIAYGGGQEKKLRSGTYNTPSVVAMGVAIKKAVENMDENYEHMIRLRDLLIKEIESTVSGCRLNGTTEYRLPNNVNFSFEGVDDDEVLYALDVEGVCVSSGSACSAGTVEKSHVIQAIGAEHFGGAVRFSLSRYTTLEEIMITAEKVKKVVERLRSRK